MKKKNTWIISILNWFIVIITVFTLVACNKSDEQERRDQLAEAYYLSDKGDYEEAIVILEKLKERYPKDQDVQVALASVYGARIGISVIDFVYYVSKMGRNDFPEYKKDEMVMTESIRHVVAANKELQRPAREFIDGLVSVAIVFYRLQYLPKLTAEQIGHLKAAIAILDKIPDIYAGPALYRAVLRLFFLRADFETRINRQIIKTSKNDQCILEIAKLRLMLTEINLHLQRIGRDLVLGYPSQKNNIEKALADYVQHMKNLDNFKTGQLQAGINFFRVVIFQLPAVNDVEGCIVWQ